MGTIRRIKNFLKRSPFAVRVYQKTYFPRIMGFSGTIKWLSLSGEERYAFFQKKYYDYFASISSYSEGREVKDSVVGVYYEHNEWKDYDLYLMRYVDKYYKNKIALDFGCGPGRNSIKFKDKFLRIDGIDISTNNIKNALENLEKAGIKGSKFYVNNGVDLRPIQDNTYDFVMSTICLQHICVHKTRFSILREMFRVLKKGGRISIQMGFGKNSPSTVSYHSNVYEATKTNNDLDTRIEDPKQIKDDLEKIGFKDFEYWIRPTGPGDHHENWIFFTAVKY